MIQPYTYLTSITTPVIINTVPRLYQRQAFFQEQIELNTISAYPTLVYRVSDAQLHLERA